MDMIATPGVDLANLMNHDIPLGKQSLIDSHTNLERVAEYCQMNYLNMPKERKSAALTETKNYTVQSLASVAYQINSLANNFLQMLDLQQAQLAHMESQVTHIAQQVNIHKEKVARREIGVLTANKISNRQFKIIAPANPERPIKYVRKPIDFSSLDHIGHGVRMPGSRSAQRMNSTGSSGMGAGPAPQSKPPTPPMSGMRPGSQTSLSASSTGTLGKRSDYRALPVVAPQVPSHYAPNYPRRSGGYSSLPLTGPGGPQDPYQSGMMSMQQQGQYAPGGMQLHYQQQQQQQQPASGQSMYAQLPQSSTSSRGSDYASARISSQSGGPPSPVPQGIIQAPANGKSSEYSAFDPAKINRQNQMQYQQPQFTRQSSMSTDPRMSTAPRNMTREPEWAPAAYIEKVIAVYDYVADKEDELSFQENAVIFVVKKNDDGWWEGVMNGVTGLFPGNYVEPCM
ncbi:unnamed protein product [Notodromas monacha]|uniref:Abl interactor 2 n=1 Tax=Notodromas monacha TaxID=399045 RepID=A0A7R9GG89_9CRUS|nr:unnamed protein product [Notodromas monacha]CAG0921453.1 unnamed protein product [Notodromas monacha]